MIYDFTPPMRDMFDKPILQSAGVDEDGKEKHAPVLASSVAINALVAVWKDDTATGEEQVRRFSLAQRIAASPAAVELTVDEAALVKKMVAKARSPVFTGRLSEILESGRATL